MSNYAQMLIELLDKPRGDVPLRPNQIRYAWIEGAESISGCAHMAYLLFMVIHEQHGERVARRIFAKWGTPPSALRQQQIANLGLLDRYDMMKPKPNAQRLARELAKENKALPRAKQRGVGSTNPVALEKQIRRQIEKRATSMRKGTWVGPLPLPTV